MVIFFNFSPTSNHLHPLQVVNCYSNSRLVVDEDDKDKFRLEKVKLTGQVIVIGIKCVFKHHDLKPDLFHLNIKISLFSVSN